jgi:microcystin-dependent protein
MPDNLMGSIRLFSFNFHPADTALCDGATLPLAKYTALFSLLGTMYGGDGRTTFCLPDMCGRVVVGADNGNGPEQGKSGGAPTVMLTKGQMPVSALTSVTATPDNSGVDVLSPLTHDKQEALPVLQPGLGINYCITTTGVFPQRP